MPLNRSNKRARGPGICRERERAGLERSRTRQGDGERDETNATRRPRLRRASGQMGGRAVEARPPLVARDALRRPLAEAQAHPIHPDPIATQLAARMLAATEACQHPSLAFDRLVHAVCLALPSSSQQFPFKLHNRSEAKRSAAPGFSSHGCRCLHLRCGLIVPLGQVVRRARWPPRLRQAHRWSSGAADVQDCVLRAEGVQGRDRAAPRGCCRDIRGHPGVRAPRVRSGGREAEHRGNGTGAGAEQPQADMDFGGRDGPHLGIVLHLRLQVAGQR